MIKPISVHHPQSWRSNFFARLAHFFTRGHSSDIDHPVTRRIVFINLFSLSGVLLIVIFGVIHMLLHMYTILVLQGTIAVLALVNLVWLYYTGKHQHAENVAFLLALLLLTVTFYAGIGTTGSYWLAVYPVSVFFVKGLRGGLPWVAALFAVLGGIFLLQASGWLASPMEYIYLVVVSLSLLLISVQVAVYEYVRADAERRLQKEVAERRAAEASLRSTEEQLRFLAHHDALTGLPNRVLVYDRLRQALALAQRSGHRVAVLFVDLDRFKPVNDRHGHEIGDRLLQEVAQRLLQRLRDTDTVGRVGGDEFVVIITQLGNEEAAFTLAEEITEMLAAPFVLDDLRCNIGASVGIALYPEDGCDADALIKVADGAMYRAKRA